MGRVMGEVYLEVAPVLVCLSFGVVFLGMVEDANWDIRDTNTPCLTSSLRIMSPRSKSGRIWASRLLVVCLVLRVWQTVLTSSMLLSLENLWFN